MSLALALVLATSFAGTESAGPHWKTTFREAHYDQNDDGQYDKVIRVATVATTDTEAPQIIFSCSRRDGLQVALNLAPPAKQRSGANLSISGKYVREDLLIVGDTAAESFDFVWFPRRKMLRTNEHKPSARIFNAVVQSREFEIKRTRFTPAPVDEAFRTFNRQCRDLRSK